MNYQTEIEEALKESKKNLDMVKKRFPDPYGKDRPVAAAYRTEYVKLLKKVAAIREKYGLPPLK